MESKENFQPYELNENQNPIIEYEEIQGEFQLPVEEQQNDEFLEDYSNTEEMKEQEELQYKDEYQKEEQYSYQQEQQSDSKLPQTYEQTDALQQFGSYKNPVKEQFNPGNVFYESPGRGKMSSPTKTSKNVMKRVFDDEFAVHSPSEKKQLQVQERTSLNQNVEIQEEDEQEVIDENEEMNIIEIDYEYIDNCYQQFLDTISQDLRFQGEATVDQQIQIILEFTLSEDENVQIGAYIFLFEILYKNPEVIQETHKVLILTEIFNKLPIYFEQGSISVILCVLEILALIGPNKISFQNIKLVTSILLDDSIPILQEKVFNFLISLDYPGLQTLLDIANKDFEVVSMLILNKLAQDREIQTTVIVPALLNDFTASSNKKKLESLAALNRLYRLVELGGGLNILVQLLQEGVLDRNLIVSTIRASGKAGEKILLRILGKHPNPRVRMAICSVLGWRIDKQQSPTLKVAQHSHINPGTMCVYNGNLMPCAFIEQGMLQEEQQAVDEDFVDVNSRDFMAALQRLLAVKFKRFQSMGGEFLPTQTSQYFNRDNFALIKIIEQSEEENKPLAKITTTVIKQLSRTCLDKNIGVREIALHTLGCIGMPEVKSCIPVIAKSLSDKESQVRAMAAWCVGEIGPTACQKTGKSLIKLLRDSYWKVRTAACLAIGFMGENISDSVYPILTKILRDGSVNRNTVCQTMIRLGVNGEQILLDILKNVARCNYKLKAAIIDSLKLANVDKPSIDFIIEELFKNAKQPYHQPNLTLQK